MTFIKKLFDRIGNVSPRCEAPSDTASIGKILVDAGRISSDQLQEVTVSQKHITERVISDEILRRGWVDEEDMKRARSIQAKIQAGDEMRAQIEITQMRLSEALRVEKNLKAVVRTTMPMLTAMSAISADS
jgi:hypothetical protein